MDATKAGSGETQEMPAFALRLQFLITHVYPASRGKPYSNADIARATGLSPTAISYLLSGRRSDPSLKTAKLLADFFGVGVDFFTDDEYAAAAMADIDRIAEYRQRRTAAYGDRRARRIWRRSAGLPAAMQDALDQLISQYRDVAGLPSLDTDDEQGPA